MEVPPYIIETEETGTKNKFPIVMQLGILGLILVGIFGTAIFNLTQSKQDMTADLEVIPTNEAQLPVVPHKIEGVSVRAKAAYVWDVNAQRAVYNQHA